MAQLTPHQRFESGLQKVTEARGVPPAAPDYRRMLESLKQLPPALTAMSRELTKKISTRSLIPVIDRLKKDIDRFDNVDFEDHDVQDLRRKFDLLMDRADRLKTAVSLLEEIAEKRTTITVRDVKRFILEGEADIQPGVAAPKDQPDAELAIEPSEAPPDSGTEQTSFPMEDLHAGDEVDYTTTGGRTGEYIIVAVDTGARSVRLKRKDGKGRPFLISDVGALRRMKLHPPARTQEEMAEKQADSSGTEGKTDGIEEQAETETFIDEWIKSQFGGKTSLKDGVCYVQVGKNTYPLSDLLYKIRQMPALTADLTGRGVTPEQLADRFVIVAKKEFWPSNSDAVDKNLRVPISLSDAELYSRKETEAKGNVKGAGDVGGSSSTDLSVTKNAERAKVTLDRYEGKLQIGDQFYLKDDDGNIKIATVVGLNDLGMLRLSPSKTGKETERDTLFTRETWREQLAKKKILPLSNPVDGVKKIQPVKTDPVERIEPAVVEKNIDIKRLAEDWNEALKSGKTAEFELPGYKKFEVDGRLFVFISEIPNSDEQGFILPLSGKNVRYISELFLCDEDYGTIESVDAPAELRPLSTGALKIMRDEYAMTDSKLFEMLGECLKKQGVVSIEQEENMGEKIQPVKTDPVERIEPAVVEKNIDIKRLAEDWNEALKSGKTAEFELPGYKKIRLNERIFLFISESPNSNEEGFILPVSGKGIRFIRNLFESASGDGTIESVDAPAELKSVNGLTPDMLKAFEEMGSDEIEHWLSGFLKRKGRVNLVGESESPAPARAVPLAEDAAMASERSTQHPGIAPEETPIIESAGEKHDIEPPAVERKSIFEGMSETERREMIEATKELFRMRPEVNNIIQTADGKLLKGKYTENEQDYAFFERALAQADTVTLGDAHGSAAKILEAAILSELVSCTRETADTIQDVYAELVNAGRDVDMEGEHAPFKTAEQKKLFAEKQKEFIGLIQEIEWIGGERQLLLIGDVLRDRGVSDAVTLAMLDGIRRQGGIVTTLASNHDCDALFTLALDRSRTGSNDGEITSIYTLGDQEQGISDTRSRASLEGDEKKHYYRQVREHLKSLSLFYYDEESNTFFSHAPVTPEQIEKLRAMVGMGEITRANVAEFTQKANEWYANLVDAVLDESKRYAAADVEFLSHLVWERSDVTSSDSAPLYGIVNTFVHGHDMGSKFGSLAAFKLDTQTQEWSDTYNVVNLDNGFRKGSAPEMELYEQGNNYVFLLGKNIQDESNPLTGSEGHSPGENAWFSAGEAAARGDIPQRHAAVAARLLESEANPAAAEQHVAPPAATQEASPVSRREAGHPGELAASERIIDIPEHKLMEILVKNGMEQMSKAAAALAEGKRDVAENYIKVLFDLGVDTDQLTDELAPFGYTADTFRTAWAAGMHGVTLQNLEKWVAYEGNKMAQESISRWEKITTGLSSRVASLWTAAWPTVLGGGAAGSLGYAAGAGVDAAAAAGGAGAGLGRWFSQFGERSRKKQKKYREQIEQKKEALLEKKKEDQQDNVVEFFSTAEMQTKLTAFLSQGLRDGSAVGKTGAGREANAELLFAHVMEKVKQEMPTAEARMDGMVAGLVSELYTQQTEDIIKNIIKKQPRLVSVVEKALKLRSGQFDALLSPEQKKEVDEESSEKWKGFMLASMTTAGAAVGYGLSSNSAWRIASGALAGGYLGYTFGNELDRAAQEEALRKQVEMDISESETLLQWLAERVDKNVSVSENTDFAMKAAALRAPLSLGLLDQHMGLKVRANNVIRRIEALHFEEQLRDKKVDALIAGLKEMNAARKNEKQSVIDNLTKKKGWKWRGVLGLAGGVIGGGLAGFASHKWYEHRLEQHSVALQADVDKELRAGEVFGGASAHDEIVDFAIPEVQMFPEGLAGVYEIQEGQGLLHAANHFQADPQLRPAMLASLKTAHPDWSNLSDDQVFHKWRVDEVQKFGVRIPKGGGEWEYSKTLHTGAKIELVFDENGPHMQVADESVKAGLLTEHEYRTMGPPKMGPLPDVDEGSLKTPLEPVLPPQFQTMNFDGREWKVAVDQLAPDGRPIHGSTVMRFEDGKVRVMTWNDATPLSDGHVSGAWTEVRGDEALSQFAKKAGALPGDFDIKTQDGVKRILGLQDTDIAQLEENGFAKTDDGVFIRDGRGGVTQLNNDITPRHLSGPVPNEYERALANRMAANNNAIAAPEARVEVGAVAQPEDAAVSSVEDSAATVEHINVRLISEADRYLRSDEAIERFGENGAIRLRNIQKVLDFRTRVYERDGLKHFIADTFGVDMNDPVVAERFAPYIEELQRENLQAGNSFAGALIDKGTGEFGVQSAVRPHLRGYSPQAFLYLNYVNSEKANILPAIDEMETRALERVLKAPLEETKFDEAIRQIEAFK